MAASSAQTVVIICPHCTTRYQVPRETIGAKGRQVQCAHCGRTWQAYAEKILEPPPPPPEPAISRVQTDDDRMFADDEERELDAAFEAEQKRAAESDAESAEADALMAEAQRALADARAALAGPAVAPPPPAEPTPAEQKRDKAFSRRRDALTRQLPVARLRRTARIAGVGGLVLMLVGGVVLRTDLVRLFPDLAGAYEAVGLGVNVVGLDFRDLKTLLSRRDGNDVLQVDARIYSVAPSKVKVPSVVVSLVDDEEQPLYQWSVTPDAASMQPGEILDLSTEVSMPPPGARKVRLSFAHGPGLSAPVVASGSGKAAAGNGDAPADGHAEAPEESHAEAPAAAAHDTPTHSEAGGSPDQHQGGH